MPNTSRWDFERAVLASDLSAPRRLILLTLATRADAETCRIPDEYSPSHARIADDTGLSRRTIVDHLAALETGGWVRITRPSPAQQRAEHKPNQYRLRIPKNARQTPETGVQELHTDTPGASATAAHGASAGAAPGATSPCAGAAHGPDDPGCDSCTRPGATAAHNQNNYKNNYKDASRPLTPARAPEHAPASPPARTHTRERPTAAELSATAAKPKAYLLVASWADTLTPGAILDPDRRELAKHVDTLLAQGATLPILRAALDLWKDEGRTPNYLPHAYRESARAARSDGKEGSSTRDVRGSRAHSPAPKPSTADQRVIDAQALKERMRAAGRFDNDPDPAQERRSHLRAIPGAAS